MKPSTEIKVGAFVLVSAALLFGGVIALGSGKFFQHTEVIETSTRESVDGLQIGSPVKYRGVPIGEIASISFADRDYPEADKEPNAFDYASPAVIRMKVRLDVFGPQQSDLFTKDIERGVEQGLRARMTSAGLTGGLFVELDMLDPSEYPAVMPAFTPKYPYVPSANSRLNEILATLQRISNSISRVDFEGLGKGMQQSVADINRILETRLDPMLANADGFITQLDKTNTMLQTVIGDPKLASAIRDTSAMMAELRTSVPAAVMQYGEFGEELNALVTSQEYDVRRLLSALRATAENLEQLSERATQDPPHLIFSNPPPKLAPGQLPR